MFMPVPIVHVVVVVMVVVVCCVVVCCAVVCRVVVWACAGRLAMLFAMGELMVCGGVFSTDALFILSDDHGTVWNSQEDGMERILLLVPLAIGVALCSGMLVANGPGNLNKPSSEDDAPAYEKPKPTESTPLMGG
jgi:hypothetical protein